MRWTTDSLRTTLRTQPTFVPISVRLTSTSQLSLLLLLLLWWGWGCRQVRRLILIIIIMTVLLLLLHFRMKRRRRAHRSVCPSLILRLEFPSQPRSLKRFSVREWIVRRPIHVFADRNPTWTELFGVSEQIQTS